jgi:predicted phosphodiesterase
MRVVVLSDIHGNAFALDIALADFKREVVDQVVCLGDAIQGGPQPAEVVARLRELGCSVVMGNADAWLLTGEDSGKEPIVEERQAKLDEVRAWSLAQLSEADRAFIAAFQPTVEIALPGDQSLLCFHGSPASFDDILLPATPEAEFQAMLAPHLPRLMTGGHTHLQHVRRIGTSKSFFFNPGSVGFAYSHQQPETSFRADPWAEYAVLTAEPNRLALEFRRVPYDPQPLIEIYRRSGRPQVDDAIGQYQP